MSKAVAMVIGAIIGSAGVLLWGYLPERARRVSADAAVETLRADLAVSESQGRLASLLTGVLTVKDLAAQTNYGRALEASSAFFDAVRTEVQTTTNEDRRSTLASILGQRDLVTAGLAKADPGVVATVASIELRLRQSLGQPAATPAPQAAP